jgi:glycosyltransferase involved in cell wall biosynthesis
VAAAYGVPLPVIATSVGGLAEQIVDGETGVLARSATAEEFAEAIKRLIDTPGLYEACRTGAARYAEAHSLENFSRALGDVLMR